MKLVRLEAVPIPKFMRTLERDHRGYPIPFIVLRDKTGKPHFTINDTSKTIECRRKGLCAICGKPFMKRRIGERYGFSEFWFVGGSRCFLHPHGAFIDPPVHLECAEYALRVCPFLAARSWTGRIDGRTLDPNNLDSDMTLFQQSTMNPRLPERFGLGLSYNYQLTDSKPEPMFVVDCWHYVEWWKVGERTDAPDTGRVAPDEAWEPARVISV